MATDIRLSIGDGDVTDDLDVGSLTGYGVVNGTFSAPAPRPGQRYRVISWREDILGTTSDDLWSKLRAIQTKLTQAAQAAGPYGHGTRATLSIKLKDSSNYVYADIISGIVDIQPAMFHAAYIENNYLPSVYVELVCLPYFRGEPVTTTVSGTITATTGTYATPGGSGSGGLFVADIPGDVPALVRHTITDTSGSSTYINRMRINAYSMPDPAGVIAQSAFTPWIDDTPSGAGTATSDATAAGSAGSEISLTSSLQRVAQYAKPSAAYMTGLFDVFARVKDSTTLLGTPTLTALTVKNDVNLGERQTATYTSTSTSSATPTWSQPTLNGSRLQMGVMIQGNQTITTPTGWTAGSTVTVSTTAKVALFHIDAAAARSGVETVTLSGAVRCTVWMVELIGAAASATDVQVTGTTTAGTSLAISSGALAQAVEMVYGFYATSGSTSSNGFTSAFNDPTTMLNTNRAVVGRARASATTTHTMTKSHVSNSDIAGVIIAIKQAQNVAVNIPAGTYEVGVVAASSGSTYLSALSNTTTVAVTQTDSVIMPEWTAGTGAASVDHYRMYYRLVGGTWEYYDMPAAANYLSYTVVADAGTVANPPTSGPEASQVYFLAALSSGTQTYFTRATPTTLGGGAWEWLYLGVVPLPPMPAVDGGVPRDWIAFIEAKNTTSTGTFDADALVLLPHPIPSADNSHTLIAEFKNLALATLRRWNLETNRYGATYGYLSQTGGDTEAGQLTVRGESLAGPGDSWFTLLPDMAGGVSDVVNATVTWAITYVPRYVWLRGGV